MCFESGAEHVAFIARPIKRVAPPAPADELGPFPEQDRADLFERIEFIRGSGGECRRARLMRKTDWFVGS